MKRYSLAASVVAILFFVLNVSLSAQTVDGNEVVRKVESNVSADNKVVEGTVVVKGKRNTRTFSTISYTVGDAKAFTEYLQPAREKGTKMLKLDDDMWIYSPSTDRIIMISGHMLRQSVMGSDMSYEDMMEDRDDSEMYDAEFLRFEVVDGRRCYVLKLTAKVDDIAYPLCTEWVDAEHFVPLRKEFFAKSGQLLKTLQLFDYKKIDGFWTPMRSNYKDEMKSGDGTDLIVNSIKFNQNIPAAYFTKGVLKK